MINPKIDNKPIIAKGVSLTKLAAAYGYINMEIINAKKNPYDGKTPTPQVKDESIGTSSLGTPIYTDLTLKGGFSYTDNLSGKTIEIKDDIHLETVLMTIDIPYRVVKTEIQGRNGTVKEYIGASDAQITINGIITGTNGVYPRVAVNALKAWLDAPVAKSVTSWWLQNLGISMIVNEGATIPQVEGGYSYQMFTINAVSDAPVELRITQQL